MNKKCMKRQRDSKSTQNIPCKKVCKRTRCIDTSFRDEDDENMIYFTDSSKINLASVNHIIVYDDLLIEIIMKNNKCVKFYVCNTDVMYISSLAEYFSVPIKLPKTLEFVSSYIS